MLNYLIEEIYNETYLISEFTFGFELEGYMLEKDYYKFNTDDTINHFDNLKNRKNKGVFTTDITIEPWADDPHPNRRYSINKKAFEYNSPIFKVTPENIMAVINFLDDAKLKGLETNSSCGFHIHLGFPTFKNRSLDMLWISLFIIMQDVFNKYLSDFEGIMLYEMDLAGPKYISFFKEQLDEIIERFNNIDDNEPDFDEDTMEYITKKSEIIKLIIDDLYKQEKYRVFRLHPQGTLEWRGPRGFLDKGMKDTIKRFFFTKFYPFVQFMAKALDEQSIIIDGEEITKQDLLDAIKKTRIESPVEYENKNLFKINKIIGISKKDLNKVMKYNSVRELINNENIKKVYLDIDIDTNKIIFAGVDSHDRFSDIIWDVPNSIVTKINSTLIVKDCLLLNVKTTYGLKAFNCKIKKSVMEKITGSKSILRQSECDEINAYNCIFENCKITNSELSNCKLINCSIDDITKKQLEDCIIKNQ